MSTEGKRQPIGEAGASPTELQAQLGALLKKLTILVFDSTPGGARGIARALLSLGAETSQVEAVASHEDAIRQLGSKKFALVFCNGNARVLEALAKQRESGGPRCRVVILSTNTSQALASEAVRGQVDAFLLKPFGPQVLEAVLKRIFEEVLDCPDYLKTIREGEELLGKGDLKGANKCFTQALELNRRPALAHACLARLAARSGKTEAAIESYRKALQESLVHYESLTGLEALLKATDRKEETYSVVKRLALYYPTDTSRLALALRLAIESGNLDDIDEYADIFDCLPSKPEDLVDHLGSALVVAGRHYFEHDREKKGHEYFDRASRLRPENPRFLRRIVEILVLLGEHEEARTYLQRFPAGARGSAPFVACEFLVSADLEDLKGLVSGVEGLLARGIETPGLYEALLQAHTKLDDQAAVARRLEEAARLWPHRLEDFEAAAGRK